MTKFELLTRKTDRPYLKENLYLDGFTDMNTHILKYRLGALTTALNAQLKHSDKDFYFSWRISESVAPKNHK